MVRLQPALLAAVDRHIREQSPESSRPEAIREILKDWAIGAGYLPHTEDPEFAN